ncbi:uncharacterized protein LOC108905733 [Anoplophora glabripennis]|uniref:uncharacterized protein LOC108905733 n=1 Tax=Anoplophora glabripennis TaxID=217634 RepID=UPI0008739676|nr:uncharacterized protein LOC108905733 [Anoplophora glabripennis]XP_018564252.1 uncharacterized protein LOC108905733 [Anoplophora glabripennis]XP_018564253.1 uncharacterized protein LOC108905733 [Anoplophora glabripennis]
MWKIFIVESDVYILKIINNDGIYKISVSDLKEVWTKDFSIDDIITEFKKCNPNIVVETEEAVSQTLKIFNEMDNALVQINRTEDKIDLEVKSEVIGISDSKFKLKYQLSLFKEDISKFAEEVTAPMIHTINYLEKQQKMLCDLIKKKDRELEEYKMEKGLISRTDLITEKFDSNILKNPSDKLMLDTCGESSKFWEGFIDKYGDVEAKVMEVKVDPWNQVKRKRKTYNAKTSAKKFVAGITYKKE